MFVRTFVHASVIISQERKKKGVSQGARQRLDRDNKREKTETVQTKKDHHVERNKQTAIKLATYMLRFIIHGYACIRCHRVFVRVFVCLFVCACVRHHITKRERKKKGVSQGARQRLDRDNNREKTETVQKETKRGWKKKCVYRCVACEITSGYGGSS